jgi:phospholipid/cholesterol/gamma-HCH transport system permease protein
MGEIRFTRTPENSILVELLGTWRIQDPRPSLQNLIRECQADPPIHRLQFSTQSLESWDTGLITLLLKIQYFCESKHIAVDFSGLPRGIHRLMNLAAAVPERLETKKPSGKVGHVSRLGNKAIRTSDGAQDMVAFIGEAFVTFFRFLRSRAQYRSSDLWVTIQDCGVKALPIVTLISVLVGLILAFVGAVQLQQFGAQIYVANLVGLGMAREMGAMMTAIIMAGRTGAAFAAQLGTMKVNQEIDAFITMGISPMEFLVLPRMLALMLMMPLLCIYSDLLGILGGAIVGIAMLDLGSAQYFYQTQGAVTLIDFAAGLVKSMVFGVLVAIAGCLRGMQCGSSSAAVGLATTSAVVTGIVFIVVSDAVLTVLYNILGV